MNDAHIDSPQTMPNWIMPWPSFEVDWRRAALLVIRQDGEVSDAEVETIDWMAEAFGIAGGYQGLIGRIEGEAL